MVGIDIVSVSKMEKAFLSWGDHLKKKIFSSEEEKYCEKKRRPSLHLAANFASKEAFLKALSRRERDGIKWREIKVLNKEGGQPILSLSGKAKEAVKEGLMPHISISHSGDYAVAICLLL